MTNNSQTPDLTITPKISIVTVSFNNKSNLMSTIESVLCQSRKPFEFIIVDGGSSDGTPDLLLELTDDFIYWISEPDEGIYDAMNKGIDNCNGDFILFLNAGDLLYSHNTLTQVEDFIELSCAKASSFFGITRIIDQNNVRLKPSSIDIGKTWCLNNEPVHQSIFFNANVFSRGNRYDLRFKIMADAILKWKTVKQYGFSFIPFIVVDFEKGGISTRHENLSITSRQILERFIIEFFYKKRPIRSFFYSLSFVIKYLLSKARR